MTGFRKKPIENIKTVGEVLKQHRENAGMSLRKASSLCQLNPDYLEALENNDYKNLPADVYTKNFLRKYAICLKLNPHTVIEKYKKEKEISRRTKRPEKNKKIKKYIQIFSHPLFLRAFLFSIIIIGLLSYLGVKIYQITEPPELMVFDLEKTLSTTKKSIIITGQSEKETEVKINDRQIITNQGGGFSIPLDLQKGLNIIKISARKKHSRENVKYFQIVVNDKKS